MDKILIFDIGKTNKKCYLFDAEFQIIEQEQTVFPEIKDEDGFVCDDVEKLTNWILEKFAYYKEYHAITAVNFSAYGASFVHLDKENNILTSLYNYLKPFDKQLEKKFFENYGPVEKFESETASPYMGFLNSGLQLYWLKNKHPKIAEQVKYSLHFPQYCSFLLSRKTNSEYTSIGCHTGLWDLEKRDYHDWVKKEDLTNILAPIVSTDHFEEVDGVKVGVGIHDSSAALVPYLIGVKERFIVISTGTWSIVLNPFSKDTLTNNDLKNDCLQFMQIEGNPVKVSRLFLGKEHEIQNQNLANHFGLGSDYFKMVLFDKNMYKNLKEKDQTAFHFEELTNENKYNSGFSRYADFETAYHQLIFELVKKQIFSLKLALGNTKDIKTVFIDGGFSNNELYCKMLADMLPQFQIKVASLASGSALGTAIVIQKDRFNKDIFEKVLKIKKVQP